jgi:hypothetical protein
MKLQDDEFGEIRMHESPSRFHLPAPEAATRNEQGAENFESSMCWCCRKRVAAANADAASVGWIDKADAARYPFAHETHLTQRIQYSGENFPYFGREFTRRRAGMADKVKKEKAPAKPRETVDSVKKTEGKAVAIAKPMTVKTPSHEEIARLAHRHWIERGRQGGQHEQDWLRAERELRKAAS